MPVYMTQFAYTPEAWAALIRNPEDRSQVLGDHLEKVGGKLLCFYYAFSEYDGVAIFEAPDETAAAAPCWRSSRRGTTARSRRPPC